MKICFFTENYYKGGLDTFLINLFNGWPDQRDEITLVCNNTHPGLDTIKNRTLRRINIKTYSRLFTSSIAQGQSSSRWSRYLPVRAFFVLTYRLLQYPILSPWYILTLSLYFRRSKFDRLMVVNGGYPASLLCRCAVIAWRFSGKRQLAIMNFHNSAIRPSWYLGIFEYLIDKLVIQSVTHMVSVSKNCLDSLETRKAFLGSSKLFYIYNGIRDPKNSQKSASLKVDETDSAKQYCLMLATYETRKGHSYLLQSIKHVVDELPDIQLRIYGYGKPHEKRRVAEEVNRLELRDNVILGDFVSEPASLIAGASVLAVPSQAYESFGLTIIEAMAFGVPVVTTDVGGMPEVLGESRAGYVCAKDDPIEFGTAIKNILEDPVLAYKLGRNGRKFFERKFTAQTMAQQYFRMIKG